MERPGRRSFMKVAGARPALRPSPPLPPIVCAAAMGRRLPRRSTSPPADVHHDPVVAYVRDEARGELTVISGTVRAHDATAHSCRSLSARACNEGDFPKCRPSRSAVVRHDACRLQRRTPPRSSALRPHDGHDHHDYYFPLQGDRAPAGRTSSSSVTTSSYSIYIDNDWNACRRSRTMFQFHTTYRNRRRFLYNTGPIALARRPELDPSASSDALGLWWSTRTSRARNHSHDGKAGARRAARFLPEHRALSRRGVVLA